MEASFTIRPSAGIPGGWTGTLGASDGTRSFAALDKSKQDTFKLHLQSANPADEKPEQLKMIDLFAWMDYGDSWVPVSKFSLGIALSDRTSLSISVKGPKRPGIKKSPTPVPVIGLSRGDTHATVRGKLLWMDLNHNQHSLKDTPVTLLVTGSGGDQVVIFPGTPNYTARTGSDGSFVQEVPIGSSPRYSVTAAYGGSVRYASSESNQVILQTTSR